MSRPPGAPQPPQDGPDDGVHHDTLVVKWGLDGARTLAEAAARLREWADALEARAADGWELEEPLEDGYGALRRSR